jgi:hypothetical protein
MLWVVSALLAIFWLAVLLTAGTLGGYIHILLVLSLAILLIQITMGRRAV